MNSLKNNSPFANICEIYVYNLKTEILTSIVYNETQSILEKKNRNYYYVFHSNYEDIDSFTFFNNDLIPLFSVKYSGSLILENEPASSRPYCAYNHKSDKYYFFKTNESNSDSDFINIDIGNLFNTFNTLPFIEDTNKDAFYISYRSSVLNKSRSQLFISLSPAKQKLNQK